MTEHEESKMHEYRIKEALRLYKTINILINQGYNSQHHNIKPKDMLENVQNLNFEMMGA